MYMDKPCLNIIHLYWDDYLTYFLIQINFSVREIFYLYDSVHIQPSWCYYVSTLFNKHFHCIWKMNNLNTWSFLEIYPLWCFHFKTSTRKEKIKPILSAQFLSYFHHTSPSECSLSSFLWTSPSCACSNRNLPLPWGHYFSWEMYSPREIVVLFIHFSTSSLPCWNILELQ